MMSSQSLKVIDVVSGNNRAWMISIDRPEKDQFDELLNKLECRTDVSLVQDTFNPTTAIIYGTITLDDLKDFIKDNIQCENDDAGNAVIFGSLCAYDIDRSDPNNDWELLFHLSPPPSRKKRRR